MPPKRTKLPFFPSLQGGEPSGGGPTLPPPLCWQCHRQGGALLPSSSAGAGADAGTAVSHVPQEPPGNGAGASPGGREMGENPQQGLGSSSQGLPAQVDGEEVLGHETFRHHVVKDRGGSGGGDARESQPQDAVEGAVVEEIAGLGLSQPKDLVEDVDGCNLVGKMGRRAWFGQAVPPCPLSGGMGGLVHPALR